MNIGMKESQIHNATSFPGRVWWAKMPRLGMLIGKALRPSPKPLLITSLPRSGSSWVGTILGNASNAMYLREPLDQSCLATGGTTTVFDVNPHSPPDDYALFAERAFNGVPVFPQGVVHNARQWPLFARRNRTLVIKSVNPLALPWLLEAYNPRVIHLVRHPAAVASSYWQLGWRNPEEKLTQLSPRLLDGPLKPWRQLIRSTTGFWAAQGVFQGAVQRVATEALANHEDCQIVPYEEICVDAESKLHELLDFAGLNVDDSVRMRIAELSSGDELGGSDTYGTRRNSQEIARAWKRKVNAEQLAALQAGYSAFELPHYNSAADWTI